MTEVEKLLDTRRVIRASARATRDNIDVAVRHQWSLEITERLCDYLSGKRARVVHCYLNFRSEVETRGFIEWAFGQGIRVIVPIIEVASQSGSASGGDRMAAAEIRNVSELRQGRFGIEEPALRLPVGPDSLDAVIVPLLAFDRHGTRLGYGKGFYDSFLRELSSSVERIGIAFAQQEAEYIPPFARDESLDTIITEQEVIYSIR